ncbi:MAG: DNA/RNA non-specific endonuclease [Proteobacteria bacterium]|nr:DNA/RNA non-specific endonuclease [Pseudomonadota bacterium]
MRRTAIALLFYLGFVFNAYAHGLEGCEDHVKYGPPSLQPVLLCRLGYALSHDADRKVPDWVAYHLTKDRVGGDVPRSNDFRADPDLEPFKRSELMDYRGSGFDRGHMAPAAIMMWNAQAMSESFLLSNMAPQIGPGFNRGIWRTLESKLRKWTMRRRSV